MNEETILLRRQLLHPLRPAALVRLAARRGPLATLGGLLLPGVWTREEICCWLTRISKVLYNRTSTPRSPGMTEANERPFICGLSAWGILPYSGRPKVTDKGLFCYEKENKI